MNLARPLRTAAKAVRLLAQAIDETAEEVARDELSAKPANDQAAPEVSELDKRRALDALVDMGVRAR